MDNRIAKKYEAVLTILYGMRAENLNLDDAYTADKFEALTMAIEAVKKEALESGVKYEN